MLAGAALNAAWQAAAERQHGICRESSGFMDHCVVHSVSLLAGGRLDHCDLGRRGCKAAQRWVSSAGLGCGASCPTTGFARWRRHTAHTAAPDHWSCPSHLLTLQQEDSHRAGGRPALQHGAAACGVPRTSWCLRGTKVIYGYLLVSPGTLAPRASLVQFSSCRRLLAVRLDRSSPTCRCRSQPPAPQLVEVESRNRWRVHMRVARSVDDILAGRWGSQVEAGGGSACGSVPAAPER